MTCFLSLDQLEKRHYKDKHFFALSNLRLKDPHLVRVKKGKKTLICERKKSKKCSSNAIITYYFNIHVGYAQCKSIVTSECRT